MPDKRTSDAPLYYAQGEAVMKRPVVNPTGGTTMGFKVCVANEYVYGENGETCAERIAQALNRLPVLEAQVAALEKERDEWKAVVMRAIELEDLARG